MSIRHLIVLFLFGAAVSALLTPYVRRYAIKRGVVATPGGRHIHSKPIPVMGGTSLFIAIVAVVLVQIAGEVFLGWRGFGSDISSDLVQLGAIALGATLVYILGLLDDIYNISPSLKFSGQVLAATVVAVAGLRISFISNPFNDSIILLGLFSIPATILYLVSFANIINLIDGLDGLAAGVSAIAAASLLVLAVGANQYAAAIIAIAIMGACVGFLFFNFNPASIFMGDEGALLLGFLLGIVSLMGVMKTTAAIALAVPLLIVGVPIFDTLFAIIRRIRHNKPIKEADKGHIHHRLLERGFNQRQTVLMLYIWSAALAVGGYAVRYAPMSWRIATVGVLFTVTGLLAYWLGLFEPVRTNEKETRHISNKADE